EELVEEHALLQRREGVDVLDVGRLGAGERCVFARAHRSASFTKRPSRATPASMRSGAHAEKDRRRELATGPPSTAASAEPGMNATRSGASAERSSAPASTRAGSSTQK